MLSLEDLLDGRQEIRVGIGTSWFGLGRDDYYRGVAIEAMERAGATDIRDLRRVDPEPRDRRKYGQKIYVYTANAIKKENDQDEV